MTETPPYSTEANRVATPDHNFGDVLRSLRRSSSDRMVAGVLGGLGRHVGIDPVVLRVVTAVLALFGGVGVLLYALAWLMIPADNEAGSVADQALGRVEPRGKHAGALAVGLAIVVLVSCSIIVSGSIGTVPLLVLAAGGAYVLLRNSADGSGGIGRRSHAHPSDTTGAEPEYPRSWPPSDVGVTDEGHDGHATEPRPEQTDLSPEPPSEPSAQPWHAPAAKPHDEQPPAPPGAPDGGAGWPEPDWGPYQPSWATAPVATEAPPKTDKKKRSPLGFVTVCVVLVVLGVIAVNDVTWATFPIALYFAVALAIIGAGLVIGSWFGRSRGLITLGIVLALALAPATWVEEWSGATGTIRQKITTMDDLPTSTVEYGAGQLVYDLSDLEVGEGQEATLAIELGLGDVTIFVPPEADLHVDMDIGAGSASIRTERFDGLDTGISRIFPGQSTEVRNGDVSTEPSYGTIFLDLDVGAGNINVVNRSGSDEGGPPVVPDVPDVSERGDAR